MLSTAQYNNNHLELTEFHKSTNESKCCMWCPVMIMMWTWRLSMNGTWDLCLSYMDDSDLESESGHSDTALDKVSSLVTQIWILNAEETRI